MIQERHRHRLEISFDWVDRLQKGGLIFSGYNSLNNYQEIFELKDHPFYFAVQFHPEYKSRPTSPSKPFVALMLASLGKLEERIKEDGGVLKTRNPWKDFKLES